MSKTTYETVDSAKFDTESSSCMLSLCWPSDLTPTFDAMNLEQRWNSVMDIFKDWSPKQWVNHSCLLIRSNAILVNRYFSSVVVGTCFYLVLESALNHRKLGAEKWRQQITQQLATLMYG